MSRLFAFLFLLGVGIFGYWQGREPEIRKEKAAPIAGIHPERNFPIAEHKSFALILYAYNQSGWCEKALRSVFEQDYDYYRVILVDDGSVDGTSEKAQKFVIENQQDHRVILIRNESHLGPVASLYRAIDSCLDREIAIPLDVKDWLAQPMVLSRLNEIYQNPDVWMSFGPSIEYPSYEIAQKPLYSFYSAIFKQIRLHDLFKEGKFAMNSEAYLEPLSELSGGRVRTLNEPLVFHNQASCFKEGEAFPQVSSYAALAQFPKVRDAKEKVDVLLFSYNRPLQLYSCLESLHRYVTGYEKVSVLYRASNPAFQEGYEKVKGAFPGVKFVAQSKDPKHDFKPNVLKIVFGSPSEYIVFGVDDMVVKDFVDLKQCMDLMEKTGAYGFYLRFGKHIRHCYQTGEAQAVPPSIPVASGVFAWDIRTAQSDWAFPNSLDLTLYRKAQLQEAFKKLKYKTPNSLEFTWAKSGAMPLAIGLYFEHSKMVNIPLNIVGRTGNPHMNFLTPEQLLEKFNQGLKIDIEQFYKVENPSPHCEFIPEFIKR